MMQLVLRRLAAEGLLLSPSAASATAAAAAAGVASPVVPLHARAASAAAAALRRQLQAAADLPATAVAAAAAAARQQCVASACGGAGRVGGAAAAAAQARRATQQQQQQQQLVAAAWRRQAPHHHHLQRQPLLSLQPHPQPPPPPQPLWLRRGYRTAADAARARAKRGITDGGLYLGAVVLGMVGFSYASVPLYRAFCQATGYGGTVRRSSHEGLEAKLAARAAAPDADLDARCAARELRVWFTADVADDMPWEFAPTQEYVTVRPGEATLAFFTARNKSDKAITGVSTYNVVPDKAGYYFNKVQCFCFEEQRLRPGEEVDMPVFFYVDRELAGDHGCRNVHDITLSYTFFRAAEEGGEEEEGEEAGGGVRLHGGLELPEGVTLAPGAAAAAAAATAATAGGASGGSGSGREQQQQQQQQPPRQRPAAITGGAIPRKE